MPSYAITDAAGTVRRIVNSEIVPICTGDLTPVELAGPVSGWPVGVGTLRVVDGALAYVDTRTLAEVREAQWAAIKAERDAIEFGPITWDGSTFDGDPLARTRISGAAQIAAFAMAAGQPYEVEWTLADNSTRLLTAQDIVDLTLFIGTTVAAAFDHARVLRAAIDAATTPETVALVTW